MGGDSIYFPIVAATVSFNTGRDSACWCYGRCFLHPNEGLWENKNFLDKNLY
jgi:hypothetical protein